MLTARQQATSCLSHVQENNFSLSLLGEEGGGGGRGGSGARQRGVRRHAGVAPPTTSSRGQVCVCVFVEAVLGVSEGGGQEGLSQTAAGCTDEEEEEEDAVRWGGSEEDGAWRRPASKMHYG